MKITNIHSAKNCKFKLGLITQEYDYKEKDIVEITKTSNRCEFFVKALGKEQDLCKCDKTSADMLERQLDAHAQSIHSCVFVVDMVEKNSLILQLFTFAEVKEYHTDIIILVPEEMANKAIAHWLKSGDSKEEEARLKDEYLKKLTEDFVWNEIGRPAVFSLAYKKKAKSKDIRLLADKKMLRINNTARGLVAEKIVYEKDRTILPISVFVAPNIKFVYDDIGIANNELSMHLNKFSSAETYFSRWDAYNTLAKSQTEKEKEEFGEIKYKNVDIKSTEKGTEFTFTIEGETPEDYVGESIAICGAMEEGSKKTCDKRVGEIIRVNGNKVVTILKNVEAIGEMQNSGILVLSTHGDDVIAKRREMAKERILSGRAPIMYLAKLIEGEASQITEWGVAKAITSDLKRNFKKASLLNKNQERALAMAINTPDIAIIQGPPGTGKTTVIKAICERYREVFESEQRKNVEENNIERLKTLITSFQKEAVNNAISKPARGDMPAYRIGGKEEFEQYMKTSEEWCDGVKEIIRKNAKDISAAAFAEKKRIFIDAFASYKNNGENIADAVGIIKQYLAMVDVTFEKELEKQANAIIKHFYSDGNKEVEQEDRIVVLLESQRLTKQSYEDDGQHNAMRLWAVIQSRSDLDIENSDIDAIKSVCDEDEVSVENFENYIAVIKKLKNRFCTKEKKIDYNDKKEVEKILLQLANSFSSSTVMQTDDMETKKTIIAGEFLDRLENEYKSLVEKYSLTTAATCQASLQLKKDVEETYNIVIVDEAARATPLDLFIPMSMGKKIILVGDHKQLPHMLEPDVLKLILEEERFKDLDRIEKSLFERLYDIFKDGLQPKAIMLDVQYRMPYAICKFVSNEFYDGLLKSDDEYESKIVAERFVPTQLYGGYSLGFVNISKKYGFESSNMSKIRNAEVKKITEDVKAILLAEHTATIGVITFYAAQASLLKDSISRMVSAEQMDRISIGSVDAFQGKEFDYCLLSCVRANEKEDLQKSVGFLIKPNRTCVAFSRAKKQLMVYGDGDTLKVVNCFSNLIELCKEGKEGVYCEY